MLLEKVTEEKDAMLMVGDGGPCPPGLILKRIELGRNITTTTTTTIWVKTGEIVRCVPLDYTPPPHIPNRIHNHL